MNTSADTPLLLEYQPPLDWQELMSFFRQRAIAGVEEVAGDEYRRTVSWPMPNGPVNGWLSIAPAGEGQPALALSLSPSLRPWQTLIVARLRRQFDLDCPVEEVSRTLGELAIGNHGIRVPGAFDGFEAVVRGILGQQITISAASTLAGRVASNLGTPLQTPFANLSHAFPTPHCLVAVEEDVLGQLGIVGTRISAIQGLAEALIADRIRLQPEVDVAATMKDLKAIRGIGEWTAQYAAMRVLKWPDAFPAADYGLLKALDVPRARQARELAEKWRPWRAYAAVCLWKSLS